MGGTLGAFGGAQEMIKQKAKETARPGSTAPAAPSPGAPRPSTPPAVAGKQYLAKLAADIASLKSHAEVTPEQKQKLTTDLLAAAEGAIKPSAEAIAKLVNDLAPALAGKKITGADQADLARSFMVLVNGANLVPDEVQKELTTLKEILNTIGVAKEGVQMIVGDFKDLAGDAAKSAVKLPGK